MEIGVESIRAELDERHWRARIALRSRDYSSYREIFSPELVFQAAKGGAIDRDRLIRNVKAFDRRFETINLDLRRESLITEGVTVIERLVHTATIEVRLLLRLHYGWTLVRHSEFAWRNQGGIWRVYRARVIAEAVTKRALRLRA